MAMEALNPMRRTVTLATLVLVLSLCLAPHSRTWAQSTEYDGLTLLGPGHHYVDASGKSLDMLAFTSKYKEKIVGMYFGSGKKSLHFYMNATIWDKLKQRLIRARDQFATLPPSEFESIGAVRGYTVGNQKVTMRIGIQAATALAPRMLFLTAEGGAEKPQRIVVYLQSDALRSLVDDFYKVDALLGGAGK